MTKPIELTARGETVRAPMGDISAATPMEFISEFDTLTEIDIDTCTTTLSHATLVAPAPPAARSAQANTHAQ